MLVPGEYLTRPTTTEQHRVPIQKQLETDAPDQRSSTPSAAIEEPEKPSFLLTLLRALGAVHT
jgi:hypothetical protein